MAAVIFPEAINVLAEITLPPVILPPEPDPALILPAVRLPVIFAVPVMFAPVPVITKTLALPTALMLTLPLAEGMFTLLFPLLMLLVEPLETVDQDNVPEPSVDRY